MRVISFALILCLLGVVVGQSRVQLKLYLWQGCPDCKNLNEGLWPVGFQKGLSDIVDLQISYIAGQHPGTPTLPEFQPWVACAQYALNTTFDYTWFGVMTCAEPPAPYSPLETCVRRINLPADQQQKISQCTSNTALATQLVSQMHRDAQNNPGYFPGVFVNGNAVPGRDKVPAAVVVDTICQAYKGTTKPECCPK